ncbi:MAG: prolipoprotein diacylglyceryl transferase [Chitinophagales bacterium]
MLAYIHWHPDPNVFSTGFFSMQWYGVMWGLSVLSGYFIALWIFKRLRIPEDKLVLIIQYMFICGFIGARLVHVFFYDWDRFAADPSEIVKVWHGGLASHGGVIGSILGMWLFTLRNKEFSLLWLMEHAAICMIFLCSFIRFGNLMNSEIVGSATTVPWAFVFDNVDPLPRHPVVLYESIAYFIVQLVMLYLFNKYEDSKPGMYMVIFFIGMFGIRFMLEFVKVPDGDMIFGAISKTQLLNLPFILTGFVFWYLMASGKLHYRAPYSQQGA